MKKTLLFLFLMGFQMGFSQNLRLEIKDQKDQKAIEQVNIIAKGKQEFQTQTDGSGIANLSQLSPGLYSLEISKVGYKKLYVHELRIFTNKNSTLEFFLENSITDLEQLEVRAGSNARVAAPGSVKSIEIEEVMRLPSTFYDPARLAFAFAGVSNTDDQANNMSIRGNSPQMLQWRLEGNEIVNPNHLSNAGTFSDLPQLSGGGTNALSAQMLGNMNLHTGAFSPEFSNVNGGVMDMSFRDPSNSRHAKTIQVGVIGIDLSGEGPLGKNKKTSYLFNYRYSFTGLLGLMGISFGGEDIRFQDLAFKIKHKTKHLGSFELFSFGGNSSNVFSPPTEKDEILTEKDTKEINFNSLVATLGLKHEIKLKEKWKWQTVITESGLQHLRSSFRNSDGRKLSYNFQSKNILGLNSSIYGSTGKKSSLKLGVSVHHYFDEVNLDDADDSFYSVDRFVSSVYVTERINWKKLNINLGFNVPFYEEGKQVYFEPRLSLGYPINKKTNLKASYGLHSQQLFSLEENSLIGFPEQALRAHHVNLGLDFYLKQDQVLSLEAFGQAHFAFPFYDIVYVSPANGLEAQSFSYSFSNLNQIAARNYGLELSYKKFLVKGFYMMSNATLLKSEFRAFDKLFYSSKYDTRYIFNLSAGKEFYRNKERIIGLNVRLTLVDGYNNYKIEDQLTISNQTTRYDYWFAPIAKNRDYFRPDLRIYRKKQKGLRSSMWSLDIQNVANYSNEAYQYYDSFQVKTLTKYQLGLLPVLSYRVEF
jgi:hypothetical protein